VAPEGILFKLLSKQWRGMGGHEAEAEERGGEADLGQIKWDARKPSMDLRGSVKVRGEFLLMCLVHNVKKVVKKVFEGTVSLPRKYGKLIEEAMPGYREEQLTLIGADV
jgi:hypothetical protein